MGEARTVVDVLARERSVHLSTQIAGAWFIPNHHGDTARLIRNLLENAIRHSPNGGIVRVSASARDGTVLLTVFDDGSGVLDSEREAIFEPFFRSKGAVATEGAGLGLGIAREIARAHGGNVLLAAATSQNRGRALRGLAPGGAARARPWRLSS